MHTRSAQLVDVQRFLPLSPTDFQVLLALASAPLHGYGIMKSVDRGSDGTVRIGLGSLYRIVARLTTDGLIAQTTDPDPTPRAGKKRRTYQLTPLGRRVARAEAKRLRDVVALARSEELLSDKRGARS